ncbi:heparinase II/III family protein [Afifella pfennigii]|uniref:heparinase II/III family protein n=1 Tax=Afifella pfennigii TaxID=209897 RepID=UPI0009FEBE83|nr:heparinase II/III family protein [Afifella pfennigii]
MAQIAPGDRWRLNRSRAERMGRRLRLTTLIGLPGWAGGGARSQLLIAPPDLRTADPTIAEEIYSGRFAFAGQSVETEGSSPFDVVPPSSDWEAVLHGFGWLRHLKAAATPVARSNAKAIVVDWLDRERRHGAVAWRPEIAARRLISFLSQSNLILEGADHDLYRSFVRALSKHAAYLRKSYLAAEPGLKRLQVAVALAMAGLCLSRQERLAKRGLERVEQEITAQFLTDGGHVTRNPAAILEALLDLLPLRQTIVARGQNPPAALLGAVDRAMPMLRFFRHSDGAVAQFNGASAGARDQLSTVLAYDEALGKPVASAPYSGFERLEAGDSVLIVDAGPPPPLDFSGEAHAGTLAFEFSHGNHRLVINCGVPQARYEALRQAARQTAAHSTATLADTSSSHLQAEGDRVLIVGGPRKVERERRAEPDGTIRLQLSHDGYSKSLGFVHRRRLVLAADGLALAGQDVFEGSGPPHTPYDIRFHLEPGVTAEFAEEEEAGHIDLVLGDGTHWRFTANAPLAIEESAIFSPSRGAQRSLQIVLSGEVGEAPCVEWRLARLA